MWLVVHFLPTSLFSLRNSTATSTGAKSLLIPSPYTIKMALLVVAIRWRGKSYAQDAFEGIRDLHPIRVSPPRYAVVNRCFLKYQKPREDKRAKSARSEDYEAPIGYQSTVGFREYVYQHGEMGIAFPVTSKSHGDDLLALAARINYFGKRGSMVQFTRHEFTETLVGEFTVSITSDGSSIIHGVLQPLDDMAPDLTFEKVDITSDIPMRSTERPAIPSVLPYRVGRTAVGYVSYSRVGN
jgi:hypothetical protein